MKGVSATPERIRRQHHRENRNVCSSRPPDCVELTLSLGECLPAAVSIDTKLVLFIQK